MRITTRRLPTANTISTSDSGDLKSVRDKDVMWTQGKAWPPSRRAKQEFN